MIAAVLCSIAASFGLTAAGIFICAIVFSFTPRKMEVPELHCYAMMSLAGFVGALFFLAGAYGASR